MTPAQIKLLRTQSVLKELIPQALSTLDDELLHGLCVTDVECKRGRYDAFVYLDKMMLDEREQVYILSHLKRVSPVIQNFILETEGWFRAPRLHFKFDDILERQNAMDKLFAKVEMELKTGKKAKE